MFVSTRAALPRGIRNNNPGNIRAVDGVLWVGQVGVDDADFVVFDKPENGFRAMTRILSNYEKRGVDTIAEIISTWAPSNENDTASYIASVEASVGFPRGERLPSEKLPDLLSAITLHENGQQPYSLSTVHQGIMAA